MDISPKALSDLELSFDDHATPRHIIDRVLDSGEKPSSCESRRLSRMHDFDTSRGHPTQVIFGNGQTTATDIRAKIGNLEAIVCKDSDLTEDLISLNPLLDMGFQLTMESKEGTLHNPAMDATIHVRRTGPRWSVDLEDLARAVQKIPSLVENQSVQDMTSALAVIMKEPKSIRERVIALHESR